MKYEINKNPNGPLYVTEEDWIKENSNCPNSEKTGSGPGSCGGATGKSDQDKGTSPNNIKEFPVNTKAKYEKVGMIGAKSAIRNSIDISSITKNWGKMTPEQKKQFVDSSWDADEMGENVYPDRPELEPKDNEQENIVEESFKKNLMSLMNERHLAYKKRYSK